MNYEIKRCSVEDEAAVSSFLGEVSCDFPVPLHEKVDIASYTHKLLGEGVVFAALRDGRLVGVVGGYSNDLVARRAYVSIIASSRIVRGTGVGGALLNCIEEEALTLGMREIELETSVKNERALAFYQARSYHVVRRAGDRDYRLNKRLVWLTPERPNILLSSVGRRSYLVEWFRQALGGEGKVCVTNSDPATPAFAMADIAEVSPLIYSDEYIPFLIEFCEKHCVGAIVPLFDVDVPVLAAHRFELEQAGVFPVVAPNFFSQVCSDKFETARVLEKAGISHPATYIGAEGFLDAVKRGEAAFPAFVKPRWGMGSIGLAIAESEDELRVLCGIAERKVADSYLRYESAADPSRSVIVQPVLGGQEYGMDVINDLSGRYRGYVVRRKVAMRAGETDVAEILAGDLRFEGVARRLSELSRHRGNMDVDVFDVDGELLVLEMNARFGGGYPFSHAAGVDLPHALVLWLRGGECGADDLTIKEPGLYMKNISVVKLEGGI